MSLLTSMPMSLLMSRPLFSPRRRVQEVRPQPAAEPGGAVASAFRPHTETQVWGVEESSSNVSDGLQEDPQTQQEIPQRYPKPETHGRRLFLVCCTDVSLFPVYTF